MLYGTPEDAPTHSPKSGSHDAGLPSAFSGALPRGLAYLPPVGTLTGASLSVQAAWALVLLVRGAPAAAWQSTGESSRVDGNTSPSMACQCDSVTTSTPSIEQVISTRTKNRRGRGRRRQRQRHARDLIVNQLV